MKNSDKQDARSGGAASDGFGEPARLGANTPRETLQQSNSFATVIMHVLGFLAFLAVLKGITRWGVLGPHGRVISLVSVIPAYFLFIRDVRRLDAKSFAHIFLWTGVLFAWGGIRNKAFGSIMYTGNPLSPTYFKNVFGFAALCFIGSAMCFWSYYRRQ